MDYILCKKLRAGHQSSSARRLFVSMKAAFYVICNFSSYEIQLE